MGKGMSQQKPLLSFLKATQICPRTRQRLSTERLIKETGQFSDCSCMLLNKSMSNKLTSLWTGVRSWPLLFYIYFVDLLCLFVSACACALVYCVVLYSQGPLCLCSDFESGNKGMNRLRTSHSEHR